MLVVPAATAVARPVAAIVAVAGVLEAQVTWEVISFLVPSEYEPLAENCFVAPTAMGSGNAGPI